MTMNYLGLSGVSFAFTNGGSSVYSGISAPTGSISSFTSSDTIGFAYDADAGTLTVYRNNVSSLVYSGLTGTWFPAQGANGAASGIFNFGQRPFAYTAPSGFKALCTQNLPTPTIGATSTTQADDYFNAVLYTGDRTDRTITVGFQPDWVWVKSRNQVDNHYLMNAVVGTGKYLCSNLTDAEATNANTLTAFTSTGFSIGNTGTTNETGRTYVAWNWKANGAGSSNTAGSITSTVSANTTSGFSIVTYTGNGTNGATVGHGLGVAPSFFVVKERNGSSSWVVYTAVTGNTQFLVLNNTDSAQTASTLWNNTSPTSTVFTVGTSGAVNTNTSTYVAYCFAEVPGFSRFGSYTGNGSSDGPFVYCGFRPAYVLIKKTSASDEWFVWDSKRSAINQITGGYLIPSLSAAEGSVNAVMDLVSNGFKIRGTDTSWNLNGATFIFAAFAESPFKYALAR
jgi:hypothetical protein